MSFRTIYTVSDITDSITEILASVPGLHDVWIQGEISNFRRPSSGHLYLTLKDAASQISCVMFRNRATHLRFLPHDGDSVFVHGYISVYKKAGQYQIIVDKMEAAGVGVLQQAFERLKASLAAEGLFDEAHKRPLPRIPRRIGVVTSATGAALRDILNILHRRFPCIDVLVYPVLVQGDGAAPQIAGAIRDFNRWSNVDVLIVGRGGGSIEDLWPFNEEIVARSIFASHIPVISAVGHEIDFTLADYVADVRAPTPSAAAELVVPDQSELHRRIRELDQRLTMHLMRRIERARTRIIHLNQKLDVHRKLGDIQQMQQTLDMLAMRAHRAIRACASREHQRLLLSRTRLEHVSPLSQLQEAHKYARRLQEQLVHRILQRLSEERSKMEKVLLQLDGLSPLGILERGYSICLDSNGKPILHADQVDLGEILQIRLARGQLSCHVFQIHGDEKHGVEL